MVVVLFEVSLECKRLKKTKKELSTFCDYEDKITFCPFCKENIRKLPGIDCHLLTTIRLQKIDHSPEAISALTVLSASFDLRGAFFSTSAPS